MVSKSYSSQIATGIDLDNDGLFLLSVDHHGALKVVRPNEFRVHSGQAFTAGFFWDDGNPIAAAETVQLLIAPGAGAHFGASFSATAGFDFYFYKDTLVSAAGEILPNINKNEYSSNTSPMVISEGPTVTDKGSILGGSVLPPGGVFGGGGGGGMAFGSEFILNSTRNYMLEAVNHGATSEELSITFEWYEPQ